jgi:hypothetical protein
MATAKKDKISVPLGDCIKIEYSEEGEMIGFLIRPKLANLVFLKDRTDTTNLGYILKIVIYLNRLLNKGQNLVVSRRRNAILKNNPQELLHDIRSSFEDLTKLAIFKDDSSDIAIQTEKD